MESKPLLSLNSLLSWEPSDLDYCIRSNLICQKLLKKDQNTQTLLVHDLRGGYLEDRWRNGTSITDGYRFWNWWKIDIFVYFSHNFVTIPPTSWIDAAHRHGVKVLGTLITEWDDGEKLCFELLKDELIWKQCADKLVEVSSFFNFDGWLLNIENDLESPRVPNMISFVKYLTERQREKVKDSLVIWYDSVTIEGVLLWQNELNSMNMPFFEACDGIFLNYAWDEDNLKASSKICSSRKEGIFVGCDVFGSECFQIADYVPSKELDDPGQRKRANCLNTKQCMELTSSLEMSFAIFAPSWTHEALGKDNFYENETRFWEKLNNRSNKKISLLPLASSFCQGFGKFYSHKGKKLGTFPWSNMGLQMLQSLPHPFLSFTSEDSFMGGGCLRILYKKPNIYRLFETEVDFDQSPKYLFIRWVYKCPPSIKMTICATLEGWDDGQSNASNAKDPLSPEVISEYQEFKNVEDKIEVTTYTRPWIESHLVIPRVQGKVLKKLDLRVEEKEEEMETIPCELLLGYLEVSISENDEQSHIFPSMLDGVHSVEIYLHVCEGLISVSVASPSYDGFLHSFELVSLGVDDKSLAEITTVECLSKITKIGEEKISQGCSFGMWLKWTVGPTECSDGVVRFHVSARCRDESQFSFLCVTPAPLVELNSIQTEHLSDLSIRIESFLF